MKPSLTILFLFALLSSIYNQNTQTRADVRMGIGISYHGIFNLNPMILFENELNYFLNNKFSSSVNLNFAKGGNNSGEAASFIQGNMNVFLSPFRNSRRNDFRIGIGLSYYSLSYSLFSDAGNSYDQRDYENWNEKSIGLNVIMENTYSISSKSLIGIKFIRQWYANNYRHFAILLKYGFRI